jgi:hypothetical protein
MAGWIEDEVVFTVITLFPSCLSFPSIHDSHPRYTIHDTTTL